MKIILLKDVKGLGKIFDVKNVSDGYARNFLIPRGLAKTANEESIQRLEIEKTIWKAKIDKTMSELENLANDLKNREFRFVLKKGKKGEIFGSISKEEVKKALEALISKGIFRINLERPIRALGEHEVEIELLNPIKSRGLMPEGGGVKTKIKILALEQQ